jgi:uncharacterized protein YcbX
MVEVVQLNVYPVKSCRGTSLREAKLAETGIEFDRNWMFVDAAGEFLTQREVPALALIEPAVNGGGLKLDAPGMAPIEVPAGASGGATRVRIWNDECPAFDEGDAPAQWITQYLGFPARLVRFDPDFKRASNAAWTGEITALNRFNDGYPLLVISEASIRDIGERVGKALPANRFRPNIVISGVEPYEEDYLDLLSGPGLTLKLVKPCSRCQIINTDQETAQVGDEPLLTLATYRSNARLDGVVAFGQNAVIVKGVGATLRVGDRLDATWNF